MPANNTAEFLRLQTGVLAEKSLTTPEGHTGHPRLTRITVAHYAKLLGRTITEIRFESFEGEPLPILILDDGTSAAVLCDPEGNGAGHLDIQRA